MYTGRKKWSIRSALVNEKVQRLNFMEMEYFFIPEVIREVII